MKTLTRFVKMGFYDAGYIEETANFGMIYMLLMLAVLTVLGLFISPWCFLPMLVCWFVADEMWDAWILFRARRRRMSQWDVSPAFTAPVYGYFLPMRHVE